MTLVKMARNGHVTLPSGFRTELDIEEGDYDEAELRDGGVFFRPQVTLNRHQVVNALHSAMDKVQSRSDEVDLESFKREVAEPIQTVRAKKDHP